MPDLIILAGKTGHGKGLVSMGQIEEEIRLGTRPILTSQAVRVEPWVDGKRQANIGLREYLLGKYGSEYNVASRLWLLTEEQAAEFYLYRVEGVNGDCKLIKLRAERSDKGHVENYDVERAAATGGHFYVIDEGWRHWGARQWMRNGRGVETWGCVKRKLSDDCIIQTPNTNLLDKNLHRVATEFWLVRNHSKMQLGWFRRPSVFTCGIYEGPPMPSLSPMTTKRFTLDRKGLAQCYDTTAGAGISGRTLGDAKERKRGIHWAWSIAVLALIVLGLKVGLRDGVSGLVGLVLPKKAPSVAREGGAPVVMDERPAGAIESMVTRAREGVRIPTNSNEDPKRVYMEAYARFGREIRVWLSDGRSFGIGEGLESFGPRHCVVDGQRYEYRERAESVPSVRSVDSGGSGAVGRVGGSVEQGALSGVRQAVFIPGPNWAASDGGMDRMGSTSP